LCGIGGILRTDGQPIPEEWLDIIDARIAYRGPDGCGRFRDRVEIDVPPGTPALRAGSQSAYSDAANTPGSENRATKRIVEVAFVHRRLSIIDHEGGHQPMVSERGRSDSEGLVAVVFNGCIYNHRELRKELEGKGHQFVTHHSDTEVLIHGWREWGENLIEHLEGMYAFAVWDRVRATVALGRDMFGEKPLYVQQAESSEKQPTIVAFASDAKAIGLPPIAPRSLPRSNPARLTEFLDVGYAWNGETHYEPPPVRNQHPGSLRIILNDTESANNHWSQFIEDDQSIAESTFETLLSNAVARRLEADVPLGCFLSGGVDSSLIAHFAKQAKSDVQTFTVRMPDARYDESSHAANAAKLIGTFHQTLDVAMRPAEDLMDLVHILGQPFGDSSILPTYWVSKAARQCVKVALSGDGGDELFLGYERYQAAPLIQKHWKLLRLVPKALLYRSHPKSVIHKIGRLGDMARNYPRLGIHGMESIFPANEICELMSTDFWVDWEDTPAEGLQQLRSFDVDEYLPNDLLTKVDTASMACGLEVRCPFLDRDLARAALSMPIDQLMPGGQRKGLLRNIARKYLPKEIVDRPKMGFAIPIGEWFRSDYGQMKTLLLDHLNSAEPFGPIQLNRKAVQRFIHEHISGKRDHGQRLFTLLTFSIWARQVTTGK
jgi:asparagine synthase (glutamine-hydrolysing)